MTELQELVLRNAMIDNFNAYAQGLDSKDWELVKRCFAEEFLIDYGAISAASGSPDVPRKIDDWMQHLQSVINRFAVTRHTITNHRFDFSHDEPECRAYLVADHVVFPDPELAVAGADDVVTVAGEYRNRYALHDERWVIVYSALDVHWTSGNLGLFAQ